LEFPDSYFKDTQSIEYINKDNPLKLIKELQHPGLIHCIQWSQKGDMLATSSTYGSIRIWDISNWSQIQELRDEQEENIEEFYVMQFTDDDQKLFAAGKLKNIEKVGVKQMMIIKLHLVQLNCLMLFQEKLLENFGIIKKRFCA